jgi:hypothetical protein
MRPERLSRHFLTLSAEAGLPRIVLHARVLPEVDQEAAELIAAMIKLAGQDGAISGAP